ncbi:hypothetical protein BC332_34261 [Capsicum chinense]|nr:hypothetical protein BC332_34261 [Capsicum chinense]
MNYAGVETSPQQFSPTVDKNLGEKQDGTKGCTDLHPDKTNVEIDSQHLIPDELLRSINLDYNLSEKIVHYDVLFTILDELLPSLNAYRRESDMTQPSTTHEQQPSDEHFNDKKSESVVQHHCKQADVCLYYLRKKSKYDPNRSYKFSTVDCNFMNIIRSVHYAYSVDDASITPGGQATHVNEIHKWIPCIFLYDSYESSRHYPVVLAEIKKLAAIIPLCLQQCDFYVKKGIQVENHPRYKDKDSSDMFDVLFQENLAQQPNESLDCGVYMVTYAECLSNGHKVLANKFDPNALRIRYVALL